MLFRSISKKDPAGLNIKENLLKLFPFKETDEKFDNNSVYQLNNIKIYTTEKESIYCENIDKKISSFWDGRMGVEGGQTNHPDLIIFATKHQSESRINSLSVHAPGNWSKAEFGGKDNQLCVAPASLLKTALLKLEELAQSTDFKIIQECTHHGPYLEKPCMFIEIGSDLEQWHNKEAGKLIAKTIMFILTAKTPEYKTAVGIGGLHHTPIFKKVMLSTNYAFGHVCPKYNLENLNKKMIQQAIIKTQEKVDLIVLDWKGLGQHKEKVVNILNELNLKYKKAKELYK